MDQRNSFRLESLGIFLIALLLFTLGIWDQQPQGFDGRWALFMPVHQSYAAWPRSSSHFFVAGK